jgi:hypothetical protein
MNEISLVVIVVLAEGLLHYIPWRILLRGRELPRLFAYVLGLLGIALPFTGWLYQHNQMEILRVFWLVIFSAGSMVASLYGLDHYGDLVMKDIESAEREAKRGS